MRTLWLVAIPINIFRDNVRSAVHKLWIEKKTGKVENLLIGKRFIVYR